MRRVRPEHENPVTGIAGSLILEIGGRSSSSSADSVTVTEGDGETPEGPEADYVYGLEERGIQGSLYSASLLLSSDRAQLSWST